jgi:glutamine kinase
MKKNNFNFGTKAENLSNLSHFDIGAKLCDQIYFKVGEWQKNNEDIIKNIIKKFNNKLIAIRSSSILEDSENDSGAGKFKSFINVINNPENIKRYVDEVIKSYNDNNINNHILVQVMVIDSEISGVLMTRDLENGSPYIVINYDDMSNATDSITSGAESKSISVFREGFNSVKSNRFKELLEIALNIERITNNYALDIEFCITKNSEIYILQIRPLTTQSKWSKIPYKLIAHSLKQCRNIFRLSNLKNNDLSGDKTILGEMPDWNPSEMIGQTPKKMALSLYQELITNNIWCQARREMGYDIKSNHPLLVDIYGHALVDVRLSLNSFLPRNLDLDFKNKLINYQVDYLSNHREYHDKIEFEVAITCYDFSTNNKINKLRNENFSDLELENFKSSLKSLTKPLIEDGLYFIKNNMAEIENLVDVDVDNYKYNSFKAIDKVLLNTKSYGTLPFSKMARMAFIAISLLRSLVDKNILDTEGLYDFLRRINTIAGETVKGIIEVNEGKLSEQKFFSDFGHLRPNSYEIMSPRYDEIKSEVLSKSNSKLRIKNNLPPNFSSKQGKEINKLLDNLGFEIDYLDLEKLIEQSVQSRELSKFMFTKNLSAIHLMLERFGNDLNLSREEISYLTLDDLRNQNNDVDKLQEIIKNNKKHHELSQLIKLPHLVRNEDDFNVVQMPLSSPTFISKDSIVGNIKFLDSNEIKNIDNSIVLIESADPGYDWIFSRNIKGLITKFGGANSHMSIRCSEFNIPAAIGCGNRMFDAIKNGNMLSLDCKNRNIKLL